MKVSEVNLTNEEVIAIVLKTREDLNHNIRFGKLGLTTTLTPSATDLVVFADMLAKEKFLDAEAGNLLISRIEENYGFNTKYVFESFMRLRIIDLNQISSFLSTRRNYRKMVIDKLLVA